MDWAEVVKVMAINAAIVHQSETAAATTVRARLADVERQLADALDRLGEAHNEIDRLERKGTP